MIAAHIDRIERGVARIAARIPGMPVAEVLISRILVVLGRDLVAMSDAKLRPYGLTEQDFRVLMLLFSDEYDGASPGDLCNRLVSSPANMTRITDGLAAARLITRAPSAQDRRRLVLRLTEGGEGLVRTVLPVFCDSLREVFAALPAGDLAQLTAQLKCVASALDRVQGGDRTEREIAP